MSTPFLMSGVGFDFFEYLVGQGIIAQVIMKQFGELIFYMQPHSNTLK